MPSGRIAIPFFNGAHQSSISTLNQLNSETTAHQLDCTPAECRQQVCLQRSLSLQTLMFHHRRCPIGNALRPAHYKSDQLVSAIGKLHCAGLEGNSTDANVCLPLSDPLRNLQQHHLNLWPLQKRIRQLHSRFAPRLVG